MSILEGGLWANIHAKRKRIKNGSGERMRKPGEKGAPTAADFKAAQNEEVDVIDTSDYKLDKSGRKIKAHRIIFKKGEDDGKKGVTEQMKKSYKDFVEQHTPDLTEEQLNELVAELQEVLGKDDPAGKWISDFVHSDNPKFAGKSKEKRKQMALAAYYAKQRNEEVELSEFTSEEISEFMQTEEFAQLDELSKEKLGWYLKKAKNHMAKKGENMIKRDKKFKPGMNPLTRAVGGTSQRMQSIAQAAKKYLAKEEAAVQEELKGNQHKLDKNKNGKLDKQDFKMLRKEEQDIEEGLKPEHKMRPGWMLKADPMLAKKVKEKQDLAKKRQQSYGDPKAGISVKEETMEESVFDWKNKPRQTSDKSTTATKHDVKKTSTGTVYTKQRDADGMSKEFNRSGEAAQKRGRGRPKKSSFGEAVEFLMSLDEEMFDSMMEEGFDAFMEQYEQLDEVSKATLGSYVKKAVSGMNGVAVNAHMAGNADSRTAIGKQHLEKARKRIAGIEKATDRLTK